MQSVTNKPNPIPQGYRTVTPYLIVDGVPRLIDFLRETFHAEEKGRINDKKDHVGHAQIQIGDSIVMMADSTVQYQPIASQLYVYVENVDGTYERGMNAGESPSRNLQLSSTATAPPP